MSGNDEPQGEEENGQTTDSQEDIQDQGTEETLPEGTEE